MEVFEELRCPVCKKIFVIRDKREWVYKYTFDHKPNKYYCSYKCMLKSEQKQTKPPTKRDVKKEKRNELGEKIKSLRDKGYSFQKIADELGMSRKYTQDIYYEYMEIHREV